MRKLCLIIAVAGIACAAIAGEYRAETVTVEIGTNASAAVTSRITGVWGELAKIEIDETVAGMDVDIDITAHSNISTMDAYTLYSADDVQADLVIWPGQNLQTSGLVALTNGPRPYVCANEELRVVVDDWGDTNLVVTVRFTYRDSD